MATEIVSPAHPDKIADRIAGAIVDLAYKKVKLYEHPKIAVEVLIGHGKANIIIETSEKLAKKDIKNIVRRIDADTKRFNIKIVKQDEKLAKNQAETLKTGDNGIFLSGPITKERKTAVNLAKELYGTSPSDGKLIWDEKSLTAIVCWSELQSSRIEQIIKRVVPEAKTRIINPLGNWTGGTLVDTGATNRKLGSDFAIPQGGGLHGKDLTKSDTSVNIFINKCLKDEKKHQAFTNIGSDKVIIDGKLFSFDKITKEAYQELSRMHFSRIGTQGNKFEKLAMWGLN